MGKQIELPQLPAGSEEQQLKEMYSYLYRLASDLNHNLSEIGDMDLTDSERLAMQQILMYGEGSGADGEYIPAYDWQGKESLKSLIIKTAAWVTNKLDEYKINLLGEYVAEGKFGRYTRNTKLAVDITPEGIQQNFSFEEVVQGLKTYTINAKNYIRTGLLREEQGLPVYGVAVGKDIVTFAEDGTETYHDGNKVAELTADELSFYFGQQKVASYTGSKIAFLYNGNEVFYIENGKIYCAQDLEIASGKNLIINSENFVVDPVNGVTIKGQLETTHWKFYDKGAQYTNTIGLTDYHMGIGDYETGSYAYTNGGMYFLVKQVAGRVGRYGQVRLIASDQTGSFQNFVALECFPEFNYQTWRDDLKGAFYQSGLTGDGSVSLGRRENPWYNAYIQNVYSIDSLHSIRCRMLDQSDPDPTKWTDVEEFLPFWFAYLHGSSAEKLLFFVNNTFTKKDGYTVLQVESYLGQNGSEWNYIYGGDVYYNNLIQRSSREVKHDIQPMDSVGEKLDKLEPVEFKYNNDPKERTRHGLIYEDTEPVMPEICVESDGQKAINYVELIPMLLKEIQELRGRVAELEAKVNKEDK